MERLLTRFAWAVNQIANPLPPQTERETISEGTAPIAPPSHYVEYKTNINQCNWLPL
jgi:hypothetical protein